MDAKITKKRLGHLLSYDWVKMIAVVLAAILVWSLIFTTSATRITSTQRFVVYNYLGTSYGTGANIYGGYSHEIIEAEIIDNMRGGKDTFYTILEGYLETGEGDVMLLADVPSSRTEKTDEQGNTVKDGEEIVYEYGESYLTQFIRSYVGRLSRLDDADSGKGYFSQMKDYLGKFYEIENPTAATYSGITYATFKEDTLNTELIESEFRARIQANKDKRYKKEEQIVAAIPKEIERIKIYLAAYKQFFAYIESGDIAFTSVEVSLTETYTVSGVYGINLCPDETKTPNMKDAIYYVDFDGKVQAQNMTALFINLAGLDPDYQYENLIFINALVADAKA